MKDPFISLIVPIYNEADNISPLVKKIMKVMKSIQCRFEIILINDGSTDESKTAIRSIKELNSSVRYIEFVRNFGQTAAWAAGFDHAKGDILITMDADLQNDPADIPKMLTIMRQKHADIVTGWRKDRKDPFFRSLVSKIANKIINSMMQSDIKDAGCSLRLIKKDSIKDLKLYGEMHRLLPFLLAGYGAKIEQIPVQHHPRQHGQSKYGFNRTFKVILDVITIKFLTSFQTKPIYMFGYIGFLQILLSIIIGIFVFFRAAFFGGDWISPLFVIGAVFFGYGFMFIFMGLIAEIQMRTWYESTNKKSYILKMVDD